MYQETGKNYFTDMRTVDLFIRALGVSRQLISDMDVIVKFHGSHSIRCLPDKVIRCLSHSIQTAINSNVHYPRRVFLADAKIDDMIWIGVGCNNTDFYEDWKHLIGRTMFTAEEHGPGAMYVQTVMEEHDGRMRCPAVGEILRQRLLDPAQHGLVCIGFRTA